MLARFMSHSILSGRNWNRSTILPFEGRLNASWRQDRKEYTKGTGQIYQKFGQEMVIVNSRKETGSEPRNGLWNISGDDSWLSNGNRIRDFSWVRTAWRGWRYYPDSRSVCRKVAFCLIINCHIRYEKIYLWQTACKFLNLSMIYQVVRKFAFFQFALSCMRQVCNRLAN